MIAIFLGLRQWYESRAREPILSDLDRGYFFRQDLRRGLGVGIMLILALGIWIGARIEPRVAGKANLAFVQVWFVVIVLILILLAVALLDWLDTRLYAAGCVDRSRENASNCCAKSLASVPRRRAIPIRPRSRNTAKTE